MRRRVRALLPLRLPDLALGGYGRLMRGEGGVILFEADRFVLVEGLGTLPVALCLGQYRLLEGKEFDQLEIPFKAVAVDIQRGEPVVLDRGVSLADATDSSNHR